MMTDRRNFSRSLFTLFLLEIERLLFIKIVTFVQDYCLLPLNVPSCVVTFFAHLIQLCRVNEGVVLLAIR